MKQDRLQRRESSAYQKIDTLPSYIGNIDALKEAVAQFSNEILEALNEIEEAVILFRRKKEIEFFTS